MPDTLPDNMPDPSLIIEFCVDTVPDFLTTECGLDEAEADAIGADILARANYLAALDEWQRLVLITPFMEEVFAYEPQDASWQQKAAVSLVVRSSKLEDAHAADHVRAIHLRALTTAAVRPLTNLIAAATLVPFSPPGPNPFTTLDATYPRAWACLTALAEAIDRGGGRVEYRQPTAPMPSMPTADEHAPARSHQMHQDAVVFSGIDPRFDQQLVKMLTLAIESRIPGYVPTLSRFSRNMIKLLRVLEILLANEVPVLTTNYLLRPHDVWLRRQHIVRPDNRHPLVGLRNTTGLSGVHRTVAERVLAALSAG